MSASDTLFSWIKTHEELAEYLKNKEKDQNRLIELLENAGVESLEDRDKEDKTIPLQEIDPFTFFCYIYKHGPEKSLQVLASIAQELNLTIPHDTLGIPSTNALKVWVFPFKKDRTNEISRLWDFFYEVLENKITEKVFNDILSIKGVGKAKLTEILYYVKPHDYFPLDGPTKSYLKKVLGINPEYNSLQEYNSILERLKEKTNKTFYELSHEAWKWSRAQKTNFWIYAPGENAKYWEEFYAAGIMALGWDELKDLWEYTSKEQIEKVIQQHEHTSKPKNNDVKANLDFRDNIFIGDIVITKKGKTKYIGYGIVESDYYYDESRPYYKHCRKVTWKKKGEWNEIERGIVVKTLTNITKKTKYVAQLKKLLGIDINQPISYPLNTILYGPPGTGKTYRTIKMAAEIVENRKIEKYQEAKEIFQGHLHNTIEFITFHQNYSYEDFIQGLRPDTENDKELTFEKKDGIFKIMADKAKKNLLESKSPQKARKPFDQVFEEFIKPLAEGEKESIEIKMKKTSYYITNVTEKSLEFEKSNGTSRHTLSISTLKRLYESDTYRKIGGLWPYYDPLLNMLKKAGIQENVKKIEKKNFVLIIDEINRANISRVFGELITLIEPDKRLGGANPLKTVLPSGEEFIVPSNLYLIGTMNTADKSIALLDIALRRRFYFEPVYPQYEIQGEEIHDVEILKKINEQIIKKKGYDFQIGHSYFMDKNEDLRERMNKKVIPLLMEYFMNDEKEVKDILYQAGLEVKEDTWPLEINGKRN